MCHRTEAADQKIDDLTTVYDQGDLVKAIVLSVSHDRYRRVLCCAVGVLSVLPASLVALTACISTHCHPTRCVLSQLSSAVLMTRGS